LKSTGESYIECSLPYIDKNIFFGLSTSSLDTVDNWGNLDYAWYFRDVIPMTPQIYEKGVLIDTHAAALANAKFRITRNGSTISYQSASSAGSWETVYTSLTSADSENYSIKTMFWSDAGELNSLRMSRPITISSRTVHQPRATMIRDEYAKRPINIRNIKWGTGSQVAGNYEIDYQMLQTSGRRLNNRFFVKNEGFLPVVSSSAFISGVVDYALPRYDLTGTNKYIFVEKFNAPGGPDVSSRGSMDINAEEYSAYNELNQRNSIVRDALQSWQTDHCGQFGINPTGSPGDGTNPSQHMTNPLSYDGVVAAYHKVNRNPTQTCLVKYGYDRQVNWLGLNGEITFDRTTSIISKPAGASTGWNAGAVGNKKLPRNGYLSFEVTTISDDQLVGLNSNPPAGASYGDMDYSIQVSVTGPGNVYVWQNGAAVVNPASFQTAVGEIFKIEREGTTIYYQRSVDGGKNFVTFYTSGTPSTTDLYPDITLYDAGAGVRNVKISNPQYDNWYVQHAIPQSELQYAWINDSYNRSKEQPFGYASNYSVPSGTTSTTASAVQFSTASDFGSYDYLSGIAWGRSAQGGAIIPTDFANINWNVYEPITSSENNLGYPLGVPLTTAGTATQYQNLYAVPIRVGTFLAETFNALMLHRNGPYQYPSWKQIRTGEHPVARYHKNNNILSVMSPPNPAGITLANGEGTGNTINYYNSRSDDFKNFIQPPVEFKYRPLDTVNATNETTVTLRSTYGNNTCLFSEGPSNDGTAASSSIYNFLKMDAYKDEIQIYDRMLADPTLNTGLASTRYREIIYPRSTNTGLAQTRGRTKYAEVADTVEGTFGLPPTASTFAILSNGPNGIDRGPIERRSFWRDSETLRNRTAGYSSCSFDWYINQYCAGAPIFCPSTTSSYHDVGDSPAVTGSWSITGTLPNSQGYYDGYATSIYGLGRTPIVWDFSWYGWVSLQDGGPGGWEKITYVESMGWFYSGSTLAGGTNTNFTSFPEVTRYFTSPLDFADRGELNSANYQTIAGYAGTSVSSSNSSTPVAYNPSHFPTASAYYYHLPHFNTAIFQTQSLGARQGYDVVGSVGYSTLSVYQEGVGVYGMRWRTEELSGKKAWFDSYEDYAEDIRGVGKSLTIVPQFNISEQMPYYAENFSYNIGDFKKQNDKFLSLPGGNLSSSATEHTQSDGKRGFTEKFFNDYSNSDFQKYFETFQTDGFANSEDEISLKCNVVKKLLPYQGFYPHQRSLQLASLFSQSLGPYISGLSWSAGSASAAGAEYSGALAVQSALQPYFAPGILHNTIKSGLACDWSAYTGSAINFTASNVGSAYISQASNYRIPFESILDPLGDVGFPDETFNVGDDNEGQNLKLLYPTYQTGSSTRAMAEGVQPVWFRGLISGSGDRMYDYNNSRKPFVRISDKDRETAKQDKAYSLYQMAMSNFLAEIPNFFLQSDEFGNSLTTFVSKEENKITVTSGSTYYMDIVLSKGGGLVLWEDYFNSSSISQTLLDSDGGGSVSVLGKGINGHSFGPPIQSGYESYMLGQDCASDCDDESGLGLPLAPAYAPYTPPYYYGKSIARIKYIAGVSSFTWDDFFAKATVEYSNPDLDATFQVLTSSVFSHANPAPASASMMTLSSSLNIFGLAAVKDVQYGERGQVLSVYDNSDTTKNRWVISTKMETPVLNFVNSTPREFGYSRGMWGGYGESGIASVAADSIQLEIKESFPSAPEGAPAGYNKYENNFLKKAFNPTTSGNRKTIGSIASRKEISEAIVAIPYLNYPIIGATREEFPLANTTRNQILDRYFFSLGEMSMPSSKSSWKIFQNILKNLKNSNVAVTKEYADILGLQGEIESTSISEMIQKMQKYVIPPELDFLEDSRKANRLARHSGNPFPYQSIEPFVMYIFEFTHQLNKQDLTDIWQGLMPKISTTAELDSETLTHPRTPWVEFFGNRQIPKDVRWMVFKVKKKANRNYYKMTADTKDDQNFADNPFTVGEGEIPYSYNWPYDYCSLIELADLEAGTKFKKKK